MLDDEFLKNLHHVLLEVRLNYFAGARRLRRSSDPRRGGLNDMPELWARLPHSERHPKHGTLIFFSLWHFLLIPGSQLLAEHEIG